MTDEPGHGPITNFDAEPTLEEKELPLAPPVDALNLLFATACRHSGASQAARYFFFWLEGFQDPTGYVGDGGIELRRLDTKHKKAVLEILTWWTGPIDSEDPLHHVVARLLKHLDSQKQAEPWEAWENWRDPARSRSQ